MEFKSQICTDINQSRKLLELGLKKETADMTIVKIGEYYCEFVGEVEISCGTIRMNGKEINNSVKEHIPAWSLHRLIEIASNVQKIPISFVNWIHSDVRFDYDHLIDVIQWLIECGYINEYCLEEK